ncbi:MAG: hypothetical protein BalsKO_00450 [Balneolaceae bacterium]
MFRVNFQAICLIVTTLTFHSTFLLAQSSIPKEYRGTYDAIARGVLDGNLIETNYRNHGEMSRWNDIPWGVWPKGTGSRHIDGVGFIIAAEVKGEYAKWYKEGPTDTSLTPVIINYRHAGVRTSPYSGNIWGWLPLNGFHNPYRPNPSTPGENEPIPAISTDATSWPNTWPDRLNQTDAGWEGVWNGFRGKGLTTGDQETFYVMDDFSDYEYAANIETEGPHSSFGVYYPSPSDSSIGGLGLQTEVRTFQFNDVIAKDMLFTQYRTTNVSEKDLPKLFSMMYLDGGLGNEEHDEKAVFIPDLGLIMFWDLDGIGSPLRQGEPSYSLGYVGYLVLEHSILEDNGLDEDRDGITDESKFNGPGQLIIGKAAIDAYLEANYDMELFAQNYQDLSLFPAYQSERWWTGDEDLDWVAFDDINQNGEQDASEKLLDDIGRDGLGPAHSNYPGPDEGEGDGIPTQGEPNFGEQDMLEAENRGIGSMQFRTICFLADCDYEPLYDDRWVFDKIKSAQFPDNSQPHFVNLTDDEVKVYFGSATFSLKAGTSSYFTTVLIFGENEADLRKKAIQARLIYESDFGQSELLTLPVSNQEETQVQVPDQISLSQNYPNPFNPATNIEFSLSKSSPVTLKVFDITGREVRALISNRTYTTGKHSVQLNASDLSSGVYIYRLEVAGEVFTKKLTLIK